MEPMALAADHAGRPTLARSAHPARLTETISLALRTGRSSRVALYFRSRKCGYHCRIGAGNVNLVGRGLLALISCRA